MTLRCPDDGESCSSEAVCSQYGCQRCRKDPVKTLFTGIQCPECGSTQSVVTHTLPGANSNVRLRRCTPKGHYFHTEEHIAKALVYNEAVLAYRGPRKRKSRHDK